MYSYQIGNGVDKALKVNQDKINSLPKWVKKRASEHYAEKLTELFKRANENEDYIITEKAILEIGKEVIQRAEPMDRQYKYNPQPVIDSAASLEETNNKIDKLVEEVAALRKEIKELREAVEKLGANSDFDGFPPIVLTTMCQNIDEESDVGIDEESREIDTNFIVRGDPKFGVLYCLLEQLLCEYGLN